MEKESMREIVILKTGDGCRISIVLDNRDSGLDDILRRWIFEDPLLAMH
jgi:hypothetical protein